MKLETIIGLEFHVQLNTISKMFCGCLNIVDKFAPNTNICPICTGQPGTLPTVNQQAVEMGMRAALALNCTINQFTKFDRKNYFYPDLPKGYQISQFDKPLAEHGAYIINFRTDDGLAGRLDDETQLKQIGIIRLHLEEDSAKSIHDSKTKSTLIDFNRGGTPLIEIVTAPDLSSPAEAKTFAQELQLLMRYLNISEANMEQGQLRCDANISLRPVGDHQLYPKTEIKNINSFRALEKALEYEINRQKSLWLENKAPNFSSTRGWDDNQQITVLQRTKEDAADYRYFPEPDIPPLTFTDEQINKQKIELGELPQQKRFRFMDVYQLSPEDTKILTLEKDTANYTENVISELENWALDLEKVKNAEISWQNDKNKLIKLTANWLINNLLTQMNENGITFSELKITAENFAELITLLFQKKINSTNGVKVLSVMMEKGGDPSHIIEDLNLGQEDDDDLLKKIITQTINNFPEQVAQYRQGKETVIKFLLGQAMKISGGKINPQKTEEKLIEQIKK